MSKAKSKLENDDELLQHFRKELSKANPDYYLEKMENAFQKACSDDGISGGPSIDSQYIHIKFRPDSEPAVPFPRVSRKEVDFLTDHMRPQLLDELSSYVRFGKYPPPELLLAVAHRWTEYTDGEKSLEEALSDPPARGNRKLTTRRNTFHKNMKALLEYRYLRGKGLGKTAAIERAASENNMSPDNLRHFITEIEKESLPAE